LRLLIIASGEAFIGMMVGGYSVYLLSNKVHVGLSLLGLFSGINLLIASALFVRVARQRRTNA